MEKVNPQHINHSFLQMIIIIIILILSTFNIYALGIAPSKNIIEYDNAEHMITSSIINNEHRDVTIRISASGPLSEYVIIAEPLLNIRSDEPEKEFIYNVQLPEGLSPGPKIIHITASEVSNAMDENSVGGMLTLTQQLQINVPFTGLYAESFLSIYSSTSETPISTMMELINMGDENIQLFHASLNVLDSDNVRVYTKNFDANDATIFPKQSSKIEDSFILVNPGTYVAEYNITYGNIDSGSKYLFLRKEFDVGEYNITVLGADVKNFKLGTVAKFNINLTAKWNKPINDVYGTITIMDKDKHIFGQTNITKTTINPDANSLTAYMDTANIKSGQYIIGIKLYAGSKIITQEYTSLIEENSIDIGQIEKIASTNKNYTLATILILLVFGIVTLVVLFNKNKKLYK